MQDYFRREDWFWTDQDIPEAKVVCQRIEANLKPIGLNEPGLKDADETFHTLVRRRKIMHLDKKKRVQDATKRVA
jgi:hypothetical protein